MIQKDRRVNERVPAKFKVNYIHDGDYLISYTKDISVDGMFIFTENPPAAGEEIKLFFSLGDLPIVTIWAKVIWVNRKKSKEDRDAGIGVQFLGLSSETRAAILQIINKIMVGDEKTIPWDR